MRASRGSRRATRRALKNLEEPYRSRAIPAGGSRHWSWLFATKAAREPLLGLYALSAEWHALLAPATELAVAQRKLDWWREELTRAAADQPLHPITRYLAGLPGARVAELAALDATLDAMTLQLMGVPLENAAELPAHAQALHGVPLLTAARLVGNPAGVTAAGGAGWERVVGCVAALSVARYLGMALAHYALDVRAGRIPFAVAELLAAGIDNEDLAAAAPTPRLQSYLQTVRTQAVGSCAAADAVLTAAERPDYRHLAVLIRLSWRDLEAGRGHDRSAFSLADLYHAWAAARRAAAGRRVAG